MVLARAGSSSNGSPNTRDDGVRWLGHDTFASLHNRNYRLYFIGQTISVSGTWMQQLAQAVLILKLTNKSGTALGILVALQFVPMLVFGAWGGVIADRFDKRRILFGSQFAAGVLALVMGLIVSTGHAEVWNVYLLSFCSASSTSSTTPSPDLCTRDGRPEDLPNAVSLNSVVMNSSRVVGPAIAGVLIAAFGIAPCFYVNAASYVAVLVALSMMDTSLLLRMPTVERGEGPTPRRLPVCVVGAPRSDSAAHDGGDRHVRVQLPGRDPAHRDEDVRRRCGWNCAAFSFMVSRGARWPVVASRRGSRTSG